MMSTLNSQNQRQSINHEALITSFHHFSEGFTGIFQTQVSRNSAAEPGVYIMRQHTGNLVQMGKLHITFGCKLMDRQRKGEWLWKKTFQQRP